MRPTRDLPILLPTASQRLGRPAWLPGERGRRTHAHTRRLRRQPVPAHHAELRWPARPQRSRASARSWDAVACRAYARQVQLRIAGGTRIVELTSALHRGDTLPPGGQRTPRLNANKGRQLSSPKGAPSSPEPSATRAPTAGSGSGDALANRRVSRARQALLIAKFEGGRNQATSIIITVNRVTRWRSYKKLQVCESPLHLGEWAR